MRCRQSGPVAQRLEQGTHNPLVGGSNPSGPTIESTACSYLEDSAFPFCDVIATYRKRSRSLAYGQWIFVRQGAQLFQTLMPVDHGRCAFVWPKARMTSGRSSPHASGASSRGDSDGCFVLLWPGSTSIRRQSSSLPSHRVVNCGVLCNLFD